MKKIIIWIVFALLINLAFAQECEICIDSPEICPPECSGGAGDEGIQSPSPVCGDGNCNGDEDCNSCREDCGVCEGEEPCSESWQCAEWSGCFNGQQIRACSDANNCGTINEKPEDSQTCIVETPEISPEETTLTGTLDETTPETLPGETQLQLDETEEKPTTDLEKEPGFFSSNAFKLTIVLIILVFVLVMLFIWHRKRKPRAQEYSPQEGEGYSDAQQGYSDNKQDVYSQEQDYPTNQENYGQEETQEEKPY